MYNVVPWDDIKIRIHFINKFINLVFHLLIRPSALLLLLPSKWTFSRLPACAAPWASVSTILNILPSVFTWNSVVASFLCFPLFWRITFSGSSKTSIKPRDQFKIYISCRFEHLFYSIAVCLVAEFCSSLDIEGLFCCLLGLTVGETVSE